MRIGAQCLPHVFKHPDLVRADPDFGRRIALSNDRDRTEVDRAVLLRPGDGLVQQESPDLVQSHQVLGGRGKPIPVFVIPAVKTELLLTREARLLSIDSNHVFASISFFL